MLDDILRVLLYILIIAFTLCNVVMVFEIVFDAVLKLRANLTLKLKLRKAKRMSNNGHYCSNCLYLRNTDGSSYNCCDRTLKKTPVFSEAGGLAYVVSSELANSTYATNRCKWVGKGKTDDEA